jgi:hypothetical protein
VKVREDRLEDTIQKHERIPLMGKTVSCKMQASTAKAVDAALSVAGFETELGGEHSWAAAYSRCITHRDLRKNKYFLREISSGGGESIHQVDILKESVNEDKTDADIKRMIKQEKAGYVRFDQVNGTVKCKKIPELAKQLQELVNIAKVTYTANDATQLIQKLFTENNSLFPPIREQGGVYLVYKEDFDFLKRVKVLVKEIGGRPRILPIPEGFKESVEAIRDITEDAVSSMIEAHKKKIAEFSEDTRVKNMENYAEEVKSSRMKIRAKAHYLGDQAKSLMKGLDEADDELRKKITEGAKKRADAREAANGQPLNPRKTILNERSVASVLHWMGLRKGAETWEFADAARVIRKLGAEDIKDSTVRTGLTDALNPKYSKPAKLEKEEIEKLNKMRAKGKKSDD